jgi:hypothetical protein
MQRIKTIKIFIILSMTFLAAGISPMAGQSLTGESKKSARQGGDGRPLFEHATFGGNGRTCLTCHGRQTGTVSPEEAQARFAVNPQDPLFAHDGSDDGLGNGVTRMLADATVLVEIPLPENVSLADDPEARTVTLRRGIPSTLNTPALDPVLMLDGREPDLQSQALSAIRAHFQNTEEPTEKALRDIAEFQQTSQFFSSNALRKFAGGGPPPSLPEGRTASEKRGRLFFEDVPLTSPTQKAGSCAACHSGPMLNESSKNFPLLPPGTRFQNILVSFFNAAGNPVRKFIFRNPDGTTTEIESSDPGRALITGDSRDFLFDNVEAFKISSLWGVRHTAPYFHDNSAKTLEDVVAHYARFFALVTTPPGGGDPAIVLTEQDQADIVAYMKLLN